MNYVFDYTANDQRESYAAPLSGTYLYAYDKERKLKSVTYPSGRMLINTYTTGLLTSTQTPEGITAYEYGCSDNLTKATRGAEGISLAYDGSLLTGDARTGLLNQTIGYAYNNDFRPVSMAYAGRTYNLVYDNDGLLTGAGALTVTRNAQNGLPEAVGDGTLSLSRSFDGYGEMSGYSYNIAGSSAYSLTLTRDLAGRITKRVETIGGETVTYDYSYDALGRLTEVSKNGSAVESYAYDPNGNRTYGRNGLGERSYSYSEEDHVLTAGADTYQFDADGFLVGKAATTGTTTYTYSSRGELLEATLPTGAVVSYDHDPMGRRIVKRVDGNIVEKYLWKGQTTLLAVYDGSDNLIMRFDYADDRMPVSMERYGVKYYLLYDQVGSLRAVADASGNIVKRIDYDSFGNIVYEDNLPFIVPFGFAGGLHDKDVKLVRFGARDYDPSIGRWTAKDPIGFEGGDVNLFGYTENSPVNRADPLGLWYIDINFSVGTPALIGGTGGLVIDTVTGSLYTYAGGGLVSPGLSFSITGSSSTPTPGWTVGAQGTAGLAGQGGYSFGNGGGKFGELGGGLPLGWSITGYYVSDPLRNNRPIEPARCH